MTTLQLQGATVLVVGAGIMGAGIAQVAAQAGHRALLFDAREGAAALAKAKLGKTLEGLVAKGKLAQADAEATLARIEPVDAIDGAAQAGLVVEAIIEDLQAKRDLFSRLEALVGEDCVIATNTSSISVTALSNGMKRPERLVGMHFFNPVPLMKLVEVVSGLHTDAGVAEAIFELAKAWGKVPVHAKSTPGFIVNRIARPYYAETLALLLEQAAAPQVLDDCLRAAGFRMGPCELMDLIGHDTNFAVTNSVYEANFFDKRYLPSLVQRDMVDGGLLGRKSGRGFYRYPAGAPEVPSPAAPAPVHPGVVHVHGTGALADALESALREAADELGHATVRALDSAWTGLSVGQARLVMTDGRTAAEVSAAMDCRDLVVFDRPIAWAAADEARANPNRPRPALAFAAAPAAAPLWQAQAAGWLDALGFRPLPVADTPGLIVARTVAMLINEAADAVLQGVCTTEGADAAMKLGVNYPAGPFEWLQRWSPGGAIGVLRALDETYRGERYRVSPWLRRQAF